MPTSRFASTAISFPAIVAAGGAAAIAFGEKIGINGGQGWDGLAYTEWAIHGTRVLHEGLTRYHAQRVLPSLIVSPFAHDVHSTLNAFAIWNVIVLTIAAVLWADLSRRWTRPAAWAGFIALFGSFAVAKHAIYYPALTDPTAFALGMLMVWGFLTKRPIALVIAAIAGALTWPALPPLALAMLIVPTGRPIERDIPKLAVGAGMLAAIVFLAVGLRYLAHPVPDVGDEKFADWVMRPWLALTLPLLVAMIVAGIYYVVAPTGGVIAYVRGLSRRRLAVTVAITSAIYVGLALYLSQVGTKGAGPTGAQFLCEHTLAAFRGPLWGPVAHVVYFGPIVVIAMLAWKRIGRVAWSWGPAMSLALAMIVMFAAGSNSRQWSHLVPVLVAVTIAATEARWTWWTVSGFAALTLAWSKIWLHIGYDSVDNWLRFPNQRYFMQTGPYMATDTFVVHLIAVVLTLGLVYTGSRWGGSRSS
ncbi:MAG: hypothetical protein QM831_38265 [Kofleriaceae bacterium]